MVPKKIPNTSNRPKLFFERHLWDAGILRVAGLDEAGRGAWAGPVYAAAVILPVDDDIHTHLHGVRDSKQMTPSQRIFWAEQMKLYALTWAVSSASHDEIDRLGILPATRLAMLRALEKLDLQPQYLLIDYLLLPACDLPQTSLVKGDRISLSIAAASVLAKTQRDDSMMKMDQEFNGYYFTRHKGYGTPQHRQAINNKGLTNIHRRSFAPMKTMPY